jgi:putative ATP-binding cassette transporter
LRDFKLFALLRAEGANFADIRLIAMIAASGISGSGVLAVATTAAQAVGQGEPLAASFLLFAALLLIHIVSSRYSLREVTDRVEAAVHSLRMRLMAKLRDAGLAGVERIGHGTLYAAIGKDTQTLSQLAFVLSSAAQSAVLTLFGALYLAWVSPMAFGVAAAFMSATVGVYLIKRRHLGAALDRAMAQESSLFDRIADFVDGFKESRMSRQRAADLYAHFGEESHAAMTHRAAASHALAGNSVFIQATMFMFVGAIVYAAPAFDADFGPKVAQIATVVLFLFGSIATVVGAIPASAAANAAARSLERLEAELDAGGTAVGSGEPAAAPETFASLRLAGVRYRHIDAAGRETFVLGPLDFELRAGETVFVTGGNGAGKTTLLKLLVGLYEPDAGTVECNGRSVTKASGQAYRELFSVVFSNYHLFHRLYGLSGASAERVTELLELLEIADKTAVLEGRFQTLDLSGGQRKRIALLVALLEDHPILVLDEWAADQDPRFRRKFYRELLPALKAAGKTIVAITHDDAYFDVADRRVALDYGRIDHVG